MSDKTESNSTAQLHEKLKTKGAQSQSTIQEMESESDAEIIENTAMAEDLPYDVLQQKYLEAEEKSKQSYDQMLRLQAEMDNLRRRVERDIVSAQKFALEKFVLELLPVIDGFERALAAHMEEESGVGSLLDGVSLTLKMLQAALNKFGVQAVDPLNQFFNPEHHQAVSMQISNTAQPGTVLAVLQKGYLLNDRLIRPALVIVAKSES